MLLVSPFSLVLADQLAGFLTKTLFLNAVCHVSYNTLEEEPVVQVIMYNPDEF